MSSDKKDLTRIEDLSEFIHELNSEDEFSGDDFSSGIPDLPSTPDEDFSSFNSQDEASDGLVLNTEEEFSTSDFPDSDELSDVVSDFSADFSVQDETTSDSDSSFLQNDFKDEEPLQDITEGVTPLDDFSTPGEAFDLGTSPSLVVKEPIQELQGALFSETAAPAAHISSSPAPENFEDIKKFSESTGLGTAPSEANPSFSVLIKNVRYLEDIQDILALLKEFQLLSDSEEVTKSRLSRGMLLVPRISEYAAILLAHKLRRFDIDIHVGLSDEIHPPKHQEVPETGIVSRHNLYQNLSHNFYFDDPKLEISQIIVSATSTLEGHQVVKYMGVASEHKILSGQIIEDEDSPEVPVLYQELAQKLRAHALKAKANAVVGVNYHLTPIPPVYGMSDHKYRLTCTGNLVWVNKL